jgi:hypothetical protein
MAEILGAAMLVVRPAGLVVMVVKMRIGRPVLAIIKGDLGMDLVQIRDGITTTMLLAGATSTVLLHKAEWCVVVLMQIFFNKLYKRW